MSKPRNPKVGKHPQFEAICAALAQISAAPKPLPPRGLDFSRINLRATRESVIKDMKEKLERLAAGRQSDLNNSGFRPQ